MRHHWHEIDELLRELDEAERFARERPRLAAVAREDVPEDPAPAPVVPLRRDGAAG